MHTQDKLNVIEELKEKPLITKIGNQSLKAEFPCGCYFVQHSCSQKKRNENETKENPLKYLRLDTDRNFFAELCKNH